MRGRHERTVRRLLKRNGETATFTQYQLTKDRKRGTQSETPTGTEVTALVTMVPVQQSRDRDVSRGDYVLLVDSRPFSSDLDEDWKVTLGSEEHDIAGPVIACGSKPSEKAFYYEVMLRTGGDPDGP